jgi:hypothetical protein
VKNSLKTQPLRVKILYPVNKHVACIYKRRFVLKGYKRKQSTAKETISFYVNFDKREKITNWGKKIFEWRNRYSGETP